MKPRVSLFVVALIAAPLVVAMVEFAASGEKAPAALPHGAGASILRGPSPLQAIHVQVTGVANTTGVALVEVYDVK